MIADKHDVDAVLRQIPEVLLQLAKPESDRFNLLKQLHSLLNVVVRFFPEAESERDRLFWAASEVAIRARVEKELSFSLRRAEVALQTFVEAARV